MRHGDAWLLATLLATAMPLGAARADCVGAQCNQPTIAYGAIAYGAKSTAYGYSFDKRTEQAAQRAAMNDCVPNGDDCRVVASFSNSCAAVAAIESKGVFATGSGRTEEEAKDAALKTCERSRGRGCELEVWACAKP